MVIITYIECDNRLYKSSDYDPPPYFDVVKYPFLGLDDVAIHRQLPWDENGPICNEKGESTPMSSDNN